MTATERVLALFGRISEAPDAVPRLRRFVLDLAVRGKLVDQDPSDEPASELLKQIKLAEAPRKKNDQVADRRSALPRPFPLPKGWIWASFANVAVIRPNLVDPRGYKDHPHIAPDNIESRTGRLLPYDTIGNSGVFSAKHLFQPGSLLYSKIRPALAKAALVDFEGLCSADMYPVLPLINRQYLLTFMLADAFVDQSVTEANRVAMPKINQASLATVLVAVPPLAEQHRIVAKVDKLMGLCDQLDAAQQEREARRDRLVRASLARLSRPAELPSFQEHTRFHLQHLTRMTVSRKQLQQLRQTIVNIAVLGVLVSEDAREEPADLPQGSAEPTPAGVPSRWRYARLASLLSEDTRNGYSRKPDELPEGTPILRISACTSRTDGIVAEEEHKLISGIGPDLRLQYGLRSGDLLACRFNGNKSFVGRLAVFQDRLGIRPIYPDKLIRLRVDERLVIPAFVRLVGEADLVRRQVEAVCATTVGNWGISASNLKEVRFPVPPPAEQQRIVAKVDELMAVCDDLEGQLEAARCAQGALLDATLRDALSRPEPAPGTGAL